MEVDLDSACCVPASLRCSQWTAGLIIHVLKYKMWIKAAGNDAVSCSDSDDVQEVHLNLLFLQYEQAFLYELK